MRGFVMSGLVVITALLGSAGAAAAASAPAAPIAPAVPAVSGATAPLGMRAQPPSAGGFFVLSAGGTISCGAPKSCLAIGSHISAATPTPGMEAWNGTAWRSVAVPAPTSGSDLGLSSVTCPSARFCLVLGIEATTAGTERPYAMTWNGTALTPTAAQPAFSAGDFVDLAAASCVSARRCVAVGLSAGVTPSGTLPVVETWNGARWALRTVRNPGGSQFAEPTAIRCFSVTSCVVGGASISGAGLEKPLLATWNGKVLRAMKTTVPAGATSITFVSGLSCAARKSCVAVGTRLNEAGTAESGFAEAWNGTTWRSSQVTWPKADTASLLLGVSCVTPTRCIAVGAAGTLKSSAATALSFNGKRWSRQNVPGPGKGKSSGFTGVSCPAVNDCAARGQIGATKSGITRPLAGRWNGTSWKTALA